MKHSAESSVSPVSFVANVARLPQKGMPVVVEADAKQRARLAEVHGLVSVERYRADLLVAPWKRRGVKVTGTVEADIVQECVVTLDRLETGISEEVFAVFLPEDSKLGRRGFHGGGEILLDADGPDSPETFSGDTIDVGALAEEFFELAIDPYPRKPGVSLQVTGDATESDEKSNPLREKLARLRQKS
jgi:Large ribosomal RNA subunit accumulation protein YceD